MDFEQLNKIQLDIEKLKLTVGRIESHIASESGTLSRETNRIREEIHKIEDDMRKVVFHPETGFLVRIDRLIQESQERKKTKQNIIALWIAVGSLLAKIVFDMLVGRT